MHDVLRTRLLRKIESLPEEQVYQVLDYIEFLESKYARELSAEASGLQSFAEKLEDLGRPPAVPPEQVAQRDVDTNLCGVELKGPLVGLNRLLKLPLFAVQITLELVGRGVVRE